MIKEREKGNLRNMKYQICKKIFLFIITGQLEMWGNVVLALEAARVRLLLFAKCVTSTFCIFQCPIFIVKNYFLINLSLQKIQVSWIRNENNNYLINLVYFNCLKVGTMVYLGKVIRESFQNTCQIGNKIHDSKNKSIISFERYISKKFKYFS